MLFAFYIPGAARCLPVRLDATLLSMVRCAVGAVLLWHGAPTPWGLLEEFACHACQYTNHALPQTNSSHLSPSVCGSSPAHSIMWAAT